MSAEIPRSRWGTPYVGKPPPNFREVPACANCKHGEHGYEGALNCTRFRVLWWDGADPEEESGHLSVDHSNICDDHEPYEPSP